MGGTASKGCSVNSQASARMQDLTIHYTERLVEADTVTPFGITRGFAYRQTPLPRASTARRREHPRPTISAHVMPAPSLRSQQSKSP